MPNFRLFLLFLSTYHINSHADVLDQAKIYEVPSTAATEFIRKIRIGNNNKQLEINLTAERINSSGIAIGLGLSNPKARPTLDFIISMRPTRKFFLQPTLSVGPSIQQWSENQKYNLRFATFGEVGLELMLGQHFSIHLSRKKWYFISKLEAEKQPPSMQLMTSTSFSVIF